MSDFIEIDKKPVIFDDPEFCGGCDHLKQWKNTNDSCRLFKKSKPNYLYYNHTELKTEKCDECKTAWKKAKIKQDIELSEGAF